MGVQAWHQGVRRRSSGRGLAWIDLGRDGGDRSCERWAADAACGRARPGSRAARWVAPLHARGGCLPASRMLRSVA
eukprot:1274361-Heterocapsa_arctica.AAC.2